MVTDVTADEHSAGLERLGLHKTSLVDYPGHVTSVVFTAGCLLRCPYCHNRELMRREYPPSFLSRNQVLSIVRARREKVRAVVISGGEPLIHRDLFWLVEEIGAFGIQVKLDTCGMLPDALARVLPSSALKFVALDIKTAPDNYGRVGAPSDAAARLAESIALLRRWHVPNERTYQFRTVMDPGVVTADDLLELGDLVHANEDWVHNPVITARYEA